MLVISGPVGAGKTTVGRLVAGAFDPSVHLRLDDFMAFVVNGWIDPALPESAHQNDVLGTAIAGTAVRFAEGGYTVVLDGHFFPDAVEEMARILETRSLALHYAVLRPDLETCMNRAAERGLDTGHFRYDPAAVSHLHARFDSLGAYEAHVIDALPAPELVAEATLALFRAGQLAVAPETRQE